MATRLRRSLRGVAPPKQTRQDQYERLISGISAIGGGRPGHWHTGKLQQFYISSYVLSQQQTNQNLSHLEALPTDILLEIVNKLTGNEQIMLALTSKTLARVVETSDTRKIANIVSYRVSGKDPAYSLNAINELLPKQWMKLGFLEEEQWATYRAARRQASDLSEKVGEYLGDRYGYCCDCRKFRLRDNEWWTSFAEFETPGLMEPNQNAYIVAQVRSSIDSWCVGNLQTVPGKVMTYPDGRIEGEASETRQVYCVRCPAHVLLEEDEGERVILKIAAKAAKEARKAAKAAEKLAKMARKKAKTTVKGPKAVKTTTTKGQISTVAGVHKKARVRLGIMRA